MGRDDESDSLLAEQVAYYRAIAPEYEDHVIPGPGEDELIAALEAFRPTGDVLELACGPGAWTERLVRHARSVTAVDAAPEMVARAKARVGSTSPLHGPEHPATQGRVTFPHAGPPEPRSVLGGTRVSPHGRSRPITALTRPQTPGSLSRR